MINPEPRALCLFFLPQTSDLQPNAFYFDPEP
jgi:hypothetical protein